MLNDADNECVLKKSTREDSVLEVEQRGACVCNETSAVLDGLYSLLLYHTAHNIL